MNLTELTIVALLILNILWMMKVLRDIARSDGLNQKYFFQLGNDIVSANTDTQYHIKETLRSIKVDILMLQADILKNIKASPAADKKVTTNVPANRNSRTEEQRKIASDKKKAWWAEKRRKEKAKASS